MSEQERKGPNVGDILFGTFIIVFGLCIVLAGGACTIFWGAFLFRAPNGASQLGSGPFGILMLLIGVALLAAGLFAIYLGVRIAGGRYRDG